MSGIREASIILPLLDNRGTPRPHAHTRLVKRLLDTFGGFTSQEVTGQWVYQGKTFTDLSIKYTVAAEWDHSKMSDFVEFATLAGADCLQISVYLCDHKGDVYYITSGKPIDPVD